MTHRFRIFTVALIAACFGGLVPAAQAQMLQAEDVVQAELLPGWRTEAGTQMAAVRIRLAPGWKTYWRAPGDSGIPPSFDWRMSGNVAGAEIHWPRPKVYNLNGYRTFGYDTEVIFPIEITPREQTRAISLSGVLDLGVCSDVCIPVTLDLAQIIPPASAAPDPAIEAALAQRPRSAKAAGLRSATCRIDPLSDGIRLTATLALPASVGKGEVAVIEFARPGVWVSEATSSRKGGTLTATSDLVAENGKPFAIDRSAVRVTVIGSTGAVDILGCTG